MREQIKLDIPAGAKIEKSIFERTFHLEVNETNTVRPDRRMKCSYSWRQSNSTRQYETLLTIAQLSSPN